MECMATSDNVVRAGLTPKLRDVPTLTSMLTYTYGPSDSQLMAPKPFRSPSKYTTEYNPPIEEFSVLLVDGPSIVIVTELPERGAQLSYGKSGEKIELTHQGQTLFVGAGTEIQFHGKLVAYRAYVEVDN